MQKTRRKTAHNRKTQILESATKVFSEKGYHEASIADIIEHAGIARGTFYLYFKHKRDVFDHLLNDFLLLLDQQVKAVELLPGYPDPVQQLKDNIERVLILIREKPEVSRILLQQSTGLDARSVEMVQEFYVKIIDLVEHALQIGVSVGIVRKCNTRITAIIALGTIKEVATQILLVPMNNISVKEMADEIVQFGMQGLVAFG